MNIPYLLVGRAHRVHQANHWTVLLWGADSTSRDTVIWCALILNEALLLNWKKGTLEYAHTDTPSFPLSTLTTSAKLY